MHELDDNTLLREFATHGSEPAFAELVARHVSKVYSVALRHTRNPHSAEEITQAVFVILARKAGKLSKNVILAGWLYQTARLTSVTFIRSEIRRARREQEAYMQTSTDDSAADPWPHIAPLLDDALARLSQTDRHAVVLRYFDGLSLKEVGAALGGSEDAAKVRVSRAVEKLRAFFTRRGVTLTATAIAGAMAANSVHAAPAALAKSVTMAAMTQGAAASSSTLTLIKGALKIMAWTNAKTAIVVGIGVVLVVGTTALRVAALKKIDAHIESYFTRLDAAYLDSASPMVLLRPSKYPNQEGYLVSGRDKNGSWDGKNLRRGVSLSQILYLAYGFGPEQMILPPDMPVGQFDLLLSVKNDPSAALRQEIKKQFGLVAHPKTLVTNVLILKNTNPNAPGLKISQSHWATSRWPRPGNVNYTGYKISDPIQCDLVHEIGLQANLPVIDETGLTNAYDIDFHWNPDLKGDALKNEILRAMNEQLGMVLIPADRPVEMLIVEKIR